jgi:hypothetical protein
MKFVMSAAGLGGELLLVVSWHLGGAGIVTINGWYILAWKTSGDRLVCMGLSV